MPSIYSPEIEQIIRNAASLIAKTQRPAFRQAVIDALAMEPIVGAGAAHRICRGLQRRFLHSVQEVI